MCICCKCTCIATAACNSPNEAFRQLTRGFQLVLPSAGLSASVAQRRAFSQCTAMAAAPLAWRGTDWKGILKAENPKALMDAEAVDQRGRDDGPEGLPALPAAPKGKAKAKAKARAIPAGAIVERPAVLEAMNFRFDCGEKSFLICLDGYSHQSGRRRVYAKCPIDGHIDCYWYTFLHQHRFPWQAVAYILGYITKGVQLVTRSNISAWILQVQRTSRT